MKKDKKEKQIQDLVEVFQANKTFYLFDYKNMTVAQSVDLRKTLRKHSFSMKVVKNRLALRALQDDFPPALKTFFQKTTAMAYTAKDPLALARILKDFSAQNKVLNVKGGLVEGQLFSSDRFDEITKLSSPQELVGKIGYLMAFPLIKLLRSWQTPLSHLGSLMGQLKNKK